MRRNSLTTGRRISFAGWLLAGAAVAGVAQAQTAPAATSTQVQEVVVTATKRTENIQAVPASVTAVSAQSLTKSGFVRFEDYIALIPGLSFSSPREGSTQLIIRGVTTGVAQSAASTATYVDEAPFGSVNAYAGGTSLTPDFDPADLAQVEVLKGPQGTIYGAGAMGGMLKLDSIAPNLGHFSGRIQAGGDDIPGHAAGYDVHGMLNIPLISDKLAFRITSSYREDPGYISSTVLKKNDNDTRVYGGRADILWTPNDHFSIDLWALLHRIKGYDAPSEDVDPVTLKPLEGDLKAQTYLEEPQLVRAGLYNATIKANWAGFRFTSSSTYQLIKTAGVADATSGIANGTSNGQVVSLLTLESSLLYGLHYNTPYPPLAGLGVTYDPNGGLEESLDSRTGRFSQEFRVDSTLFNRLDYQVGFYFTHESDALTIPGFFPFDTVTRAPLVLAPAYTPLISAAILSRYTEYSGFANATYHFNDRFSILGGVRYSSNDQHYFQNYHGYLVQFGVLPPIIFNNQASEHDTTFLVSPQYKIDSNNLVYARVGTGYRPGGPNAVPATAIFAPPTYLADSLTQYEVGYKGQYFNHRVVLDAAIYYTDWNNIQIQTNALFLGTNYNFFVNGGKAVTQGGELSVAWVPVRGLTLGGNVAYTDAHLSTPAKAAGGAAGDELPFVPKWTGAATAQYTWPLFGEWNGTVGAGVNYTGSRVSNFSGHFGVPVPAYTTVSLNAGIDNGRWSFNAYVKNLNDARGIVYVSPANAPAAADPRGSAVIIQPLTFGADLSVKF